MSCPLMACKPVRTSVTESKCNVEPNTCRLLLSAGYVPEGVQTMLVQASPYGPFGRRHENRRCLLDDASTNILLSSILAGMPAKPMTGQAFYVLTALADRPRHGYGIVGEVAELSQGRVKLKIGSLYGVLDRLAAEGLIEPDRDEAHDGRLRRYYRLTPNGRRALAEEAELRAATARVVRARLRLAREQAAG
jgi:PadR family transcriptional regulator, regulatory protein PadR